MIKVLFLIFNFFFLFLVQLHKKPKELCASCVRKFSACLTLVQSHGKTKDFPCDCVQKFQESLAPVQAHGIIKDFSCDSVQKISALKNLCARTTLSLTLHECCAKNFRIKEKTFL